MFTESQLSPASSHPLTLPIKPEEINAIAMYQALLPEPGNPYVLLTSELKLGLAQNIIENLQNLAQAYPGVYDSRIATEREALIQHLRADGIDTSRLQLQSTDDMSQLVAPLGSVRPWESPYSGDWSMPGERLADPIDHHPMQETSTRTLPKTGGSVTINVPNGSTTVSLESNSTPYTTEFDPTVTITPGAATLWNPQGLSFIDITIRDDRQNVLYSGTIGGRELQNLEIPGLTLGSNVQVEMNYKPHPVIDLR